MCSFLDIECLYCCGVAACWYSGEGRISCKEVVVFYEVILIFYVRIIDCYIFACEGVKMEIQMRRTRESERRIDQGK